MRCKGIGGFLKIQEMWELKVDVNYELNLFLIQVKACK